MRLALLDELQKIWNNIIRKERVTNEEIVLKSKGQTKCTKSKAEVVRVK